MTALLVAAALGFGAASLLAERRQRALDNSPDGVLSLDLAAQEPQFSSDLVARDGEVAVQVTVVLRNTGPRTVALESAELVGTGYAADDVAGRRMAPDRSTSVRLLRPVRCDDLAPLGPVGPLRVRATTGAGARSTELWMETQGIAWSAGFAAAACGLAAPGQSLVAIDTTPTRVVGDRAEVGFELSSASRAPLVLQSLQLPPGLRLVALQDAAGGDVTLPLRMLPGDFDPPTQPMRDAARHSAWSPSWRWPTAPPSPSAPRTRRTCRCSRPPRPTSAAAARARRRTTSTAGWASTAGSAPEAAAGATPRWSTGSARAPARYASRR